MKNLALCLVLFLAVLSNACGRETNDDCWRMRNLLLQVNVAHISLDMVASQVNAFENDHPQRTTWDMITRERHLALVWSQEAHAARHHRAITAYNDAAATLSPRFLRTHSLPERVDSSHTDR